MKSKAEDYMEGKGICYLDFTRSELFALIEKIRLRCNCYIAAEQRKEEQKKYKNKPL